MPAPRHAGVHAAPTDRQTFLSAGICNPVNGVGNRIIAFFAFYGEREKRRRDPTSAKNAFEESPLPEATVQTFFRPIARPVEMAGVQPPEG